MVLRKQEPVQRFGQMPLPEPDAHANTKGGNEGTFPHAADVMQLGQGQNDSQRHNRPVKENFTGGHGFSGDLCQGERYAICRHGEDIGCNIQENTRTEKAHAAQHIQEFDRIDRISRQQAG